MHPVDKRDQDPHAPEESEEIQKAGQRHCDKGQNQNRHLHRRLKEEYYLNPSEESDDPFESSRFHCLVVNPSGIYGVYALRTVHEYGRYFAFGSGSEYALGALHALYNRLASARRIATAALDAACTFDDSSDLPATVKTMRIRKPRAAQRTR